MPERRPMWNSAVTLFQDYMGTGLITIWFLIALLYLFIKEKRKPIRVMFIYVPVAVLLVFFNPLFISLFYRMADGEIYYRLLWLLPVTPVLAYSTVALYGGLKERAKTVFALGAAFLIMISGSYIYHNEFFQKAENLYHMPQAVVDICDAIEIEGREVMAVFPAELLQYVRQYSPTVCMPYGREVIVNSQYYYNDLYDAMEEEIIDAAKVGEWAKRYWCVYIILPSEKEMEGSLRDYAYDFYDEIGGYTLYKYTRDTFM